MIALFIVVGVLAFLLFVPLSLGVDYKEELTVSVGLFAPFIRVFSTGKPPKKKNKEGQKPQNERAPIDKHLLWELVKEIPGHVRRLLTVQKLKLDVSVGHEDPGNLALLYGTAHAALDTVAVALSPIYPKEKWIVRVDADFNSKQTVIRGSARAYTNLWRIFYVLISLFFCGILKLKSPTGDEKKESNNG